MLNLSYIICTREVPSETIFARKQTRDKQDGRIIYWIHVAKKYSEM